MGAFEDREEGFEKRFAMGERRRFNVLASSPRETTGPMGRRRDEPHRRGERA
jgi:hypothetical protein